jgi:hypothetical protein
MLKRFVSAIQIRYAKMVSMLDLQTLTPCNILEEHTAYTFRAQGDSMCLRNVGIYQSTRRYNKEQRNRHLHCGEDVTSGKFCFES